MVELFNLFIKTQGINFSIRHDGGSNIPYLQIIDINSSTTTYATTGSIPQSTGIYSISGSDGKTLKFTTTASFFYGSSKYLSSGSSVSSSYSNIENNFEVQSGDVIRFGSFFSKDPTYYNVVNVFPPQITFSGSVPTITTPLVLTLDKSADTSLALSGSDFTILRRKPDETSVIVNFLKPVGETSQAILISDDLSTNVKNQAANIASGLSQQLNQL
jgi:hypothetical protein